MSQTTAVTEKLGNIFGSAFKDPQAAQRAVPVRSAGPFTPPDNPSHSFTEAHARLLVAWVWAGVSKNLMLTGPTGSGKSSMVEVFAARTGWPLFRVACHGRMEFQELVGAWRMASVPGGGQEWKWADGPLLAAMKVGGILLLDEGNFLHPAVIGGLNTILDGAPLLVPETGEMVQPHPDFRVAFTANAVAHDMDAANYRGIQRQSIALLDRFLVGTVDYLTPMEESKILHAKCKHLAGPFIQLLVEVAGDVREAFKQGEMTTTISTRGLIRWGKMLLANGRSLADASARGATEEVLACLNGALHAAVTARSPEAEREAIEKIVSARYAPVK